MPVPHWLARVATGLGLAASKPLTLQVLPNGSPISAEPFSIQANDWADFRKQVEGHFGEPLTRDTSKEWWLSDVNGRKLSSWEDLTSLGPKPIVHAVPSGRLFQWGPRSIGDRFPVSISDREGVEMETVAHSPRIFLIHNLMSEEEAMSLIDAAYARTGPNKLMASSVGFATKGKRNVESLRTSASAFDSESEVAKRVLIRAFDVTRVPYQESLADGLQILQYKEGQAYVAHTDWFPVDTGNNVQNFNTEVPGGSNRFATVFLYLWSPPSGGYTVFPEASLEESVKDSAFVSTGKNPAAAEQARKLAKMHYNQSDWEMKLVEQCYSKLAVKPVHLGAALFYHQEPMTGKLLTEATHGACPSLTGTKWGANLWIWNTARHLSDDSKVESVHATFKNDEADALDLQWSTDEGHEWVLFGTCPSAHSLKANTYSSHWWRFVKSGTETEVRRFVVPAGSASVSFHSDRAEPVVEEARMDL